MASLIVIEPSGRQTRVELVPLPFKIGRHPDNHLIVRDSRVSRNHVHILLENSEYIIQDAHSSHGTFVNGARVERQQLRNGDRIEFGFPDSHQLVFALDGAELNRLMEQFTAPAAGSNLAKLRAVLDVARSLQTSFSIQDVLASVVDAAITVTNAERGFLLLRQGKALQTRVARDRHGKPLAEADLRVPRKLIYRALEERRELLSMNFDAAAAVGLSPERSVADLELRSVICVPLVRIQEGTSDQTSMLSGQDTTVGVLYLDSRADAADLAGGGRELLHTLAIEASTVLENARLLEEERIKQKMEEELQVARSIQQSLLPRRLPADGWIRVLGRSIASHQVGGDYFDFIQVNESCCAVVVADVAGKGVSSALLASFLQGAFLALSDSSALFGEKVQRLNQFLHERTEGGKYATILYCMLNRSGRLSYLNAGHCAAILVTRKGKLQLLETTAPPVGLLEKATFPLEEIEISTGDKLVIYTDGVTEARNPAGEFFGRKRLRETIAANAAASCAELYQTLENAVKAFTEDAPQADDVTIVVLEYSASHS